MPLFPARGGTVEPCADLPDTPRYCVAYPLYFSSLQDFQRAWADQTRFRWACRIRSQHVIWFGSLEFRATGNGYLMERLPPRVNSDIPALPPRHQNRMGERAMNWHHGGRRRPLAGNIDSDADRRLVKATAHRPSVAGCGPLP